MIQSRYLFRGKRQDNGKWLTGFLYGNKFGKRFILPYNCHSDTGLSNANYINPATIGQCTGLKDKNGKLIFEGDILFCEPYTIYEDSYRSVVNWVDSGFVWDIEIEDEPLRTEILHYLEIIGNVHDTPQ